jgi:hypothetical protein
VPAGPLFGWREHADVNNPFWRGVPEALHGLDIDAIRNLPPLSTDRSRFWNYAWTEFVNQAAQARVLDITHGLLVAPGNVVIEAGQNDRPAYVAAAIYSLGWILLVLRSSVHVSGLDNVCTRRCRLMCMSADHVAVGGAAPVPYGVTAINV